MDIICTNIFQNEGVAALSNDQRALRDRVSGLYLSFNEIQRLLWAAIRECREHIYGVKGGRACCIICGHDGGWYCPEAPLHVCQYDWSENGEWCIYCSEPKERK